MPKKGGLGQFADLGGGGGLTRKRGWGGVGGGGVDSPMHTMSKEIIGKEFQSLPVREKKLLT